MQWIGAVADALLGSPQDLTPKRPVKKGKGKSVSEETAQKVGVSLSPFSPTGFAGKGSFPPQPSSPPLRRRTKQVAASSATPTKVVQSFTSPAAKAAASAQQAGVVISPSRMPLPSLEGFVGMEVDDAAHTPPAAPRAVSGTPKRRALPMPSLDGFDDDERMDRAALSGACGPLCPPTPVKRRTSAAMTQRNKLYCEARERVLKDELISLSSRGHYKDVFRQGPHVIKVYKPECTLTENLQVLTRNALEQREECEAAKIPCAKLDNDPLEEGYFKEEYVPFSIQEKLPFITGNQEQPFTTEQKEQIEPYVESIANIFVQAAQKDMALDLQPDNLRVREDGAVVLIDFREEEAEKDEVYPLLRGSLKKVDDRVTTWDSLSRRFARALIERIREKLGESATAFFSDFQS